MSQRRLWLAVVFGLSGTLVACGATAGGSGVTARRGDPEANYPAMRFVQDGEPLGVLGSDGEVTLEGGEYVGTVWSNGQVTDHLGENVLALTSGGNVVFSTVQREPMRLADHALMYEPGAILDIDEGGNFRMGEEVVGIYIEGYRPEFVETAFLGWLALHFATIPWRRSLTLEARNNLATMYELLGTYMESHDSLPSSAPTTPATIACGRQGQWPAGAPAPFSEIGFSISDPIHYVYAMEVDGSSFVLRASADLDCNGVSGRFELHGELVDGELTREPLLRVTNELE